MTPTLFFRLLHHGDKGEALAERVGAFREGRADGDLYTADPESFRQVPNTPFCYWVSERIRRLFKELPPFESEGRTVKQGLATADDFRFVRAWWEVPAARILDGGQGTGDGEGKWAAERIRAFQAWCRRRTCEGKRWVPFAKGGEYAPYYADIHLVVNWEKEGAEIRNFIDPKTGRTNSRPQNIDYYFRPGLTWPLRAHRFAPQIMEAGSIFSVRGYSAFPDPGRELETLAVFNSNAFDYIFKTALGRFGFPEFIVGILQGLPWYNITYQHAHKTLRNLAEQIICAVRSLDIVNENSHAYTLPALLHNQRKVFSETITDHRRRKAEAETEIYRIRAEINEIAYHLYGFTDEERRGVVDGQEAVDIAQSDLRNEDGLDVPHNDDQEDVAASDPTDYQSLLTVHLLSWCVGAAFGRFDIRLALPAAHRLLTTNPPDPFDPLPVCPPGMLVGPDGLPAEPNRIVSEEWLRTRPDANTLPPEGSVKKPTIPDSEYPLRISWDGILVDDPGFNGAQPHRDDVVRRVREVFDLLWKDKAHEIEQETCDILGVTDLRDYFRRPAGFFQDHLKRYSKSRRKAPIYQPLATASGAYTIWLYYHRLNDQTLYGAVNKYVEPKIAEVQWAVDSYQCSVEARKKGQPDAQHPDHRSLTTSQLRKQWEEARAFLVELRDLREELLRIAALPYKPDLNDGVIINAAPFHGLFRLRTWGKDTEDCWKKLGKGDYDWAHLAYTVWPDRVRGVCKRDRSIAIAHGLEDLCKVEAPESKKKGGRGRREKEAAR